MSSIINLAVAPGITLNAGSILQLQAAILSSQHFDEAAATFATLTAQLLGFERICVGFMEDEQVTLIAISHGAALDVRQEINRNLAAAMEEAIDQSATLSFPHTASGHPRITLAHAELVQRNSGSVCTVPIANLGAIVGAVTAERDSNDPFSAQQIAQLEQVVALVGSLLALKRDSQRPWRKQAWEMLRKIRARLTGPGEHQLKLMVGGGVLAGIILLLIPMPYHVSAPARLEGAIQRALVAPVDGFIQQVSVRPGDSVTEGQVLAELATQDLLLEQRKWESELAQHENTYGAALAQNDRSQLIVYQAKVAESQAQLELVESQIERTRIKAPFNGIVISGDLSQSLGAPIQRGDVVMVIAPRDRYRLIVEVDERDVADIKPGARGRISLAALPGEALSFRTERVAPVAVTRVGRHFFELEGKLDVNTPELRPGLQGVAKIDAGKHTLAWALSHRFLVWLSLTLWAWTG
ncbi:MAG: efflux RND transporter periplasmic adaptor subunit [Gallionella sp.]|nr:efflux RND transporter periplasmic adaptor subunit [Gallionella sp.]